MRKITILCVVAALCSATAISAQDGIYGSFIVGQKFVKLQALNDSLAGYGIVFPGNNWTFGGEGHIIVAKHFVIGGKGMGFFNEQKQMLNALTDSVRFFKISGGMGIASIGYAFTGGEGSGLRLYPQLGAGVAPFLLQTKTRFAPNSNTFGSIISNQADNMAVIEKVGLVLDAALSFDWYMKFIHLLAIVPGLETGPMLHLEAGYSYIPANLHWFRDVDKLESFEPDLKFDGFYFNVGIGIGISSSK